MKDHDAKLFPLRVFRVAEGQNAIVRTLSDCYGGISTHYFRGKSRVCEGNDCPSVYHSTDRFWKGYTPVEVWDESQTHYVPVVLEISEHLELDFRGIFDRGQLWSITRGMKKKGRGSPMSATLLEERDGTTFPPAFDIIPCLRNLYHVERISLTVQNPLPDRVLTTFSQGEAPACLQPKPKKVEVDERPAFETFQKRFQQQKKEAHINGKK